MRKALTGAAMLSLLALAAAGPPPTPAIAHIDTLFGMRFEDPYHWMEAGGQTFDTWLAVQAAYTRDTLDAIPGRAPLLAELRRLSGGETHVGGAIMAGGRWLYTKTRPEDSTAKIFVRSPDGGAEALLVDPARYDANGQTAEIDYWSVSPNGRYVAYGISLGGAETGTLRITEVATGAELPEAIDRTRYARPNWLDDELLLYSRMPPAPAGKSADLTGGQVLLHRIGTDPAGDVGVFGPGLVPGTSMPANYFYRGLAAARSSFVVGEYDAGLTSSPKVVFTTPRANLGKTAVWRRVAGFDDEVRGVVLHDDMLYLRIARKAPRQRIVRTPAAHPDLRRAETVLPESAGTITAMVAAADALYVRRDEGGIGRLVRIPWGGKPEVPATPFEGAIMRLNANATVPGVLLSMQGWTRSQTVYAFNPATKRFTDTGIAPPSPVSFEDIEWTDARAPAADGAMVPVSIVAPRGAVRDGRHPLLLYAYGAYGVTLEPQFDATRRAWFDHGGIYAVAHVRGSGGFGDDWHRAGRLDKKQNSVTDFIADARYLQRSGWASTTTLAAVGGSAGGIVIGGAIVRQPELFSAAIIQVGLVNMLRLEQIPIGPFNTGEFGSTETEEGVRLLYAIDAYQNIRRGIEYPGVLIATGRNDARVSPWMPAKFAARLQTHDANFGRRPDLLRVEDAGGHAGGNKQEAEVEQADFFTFLLWQAGMAGFQPSAR
jgi:prolyl oligopeptidase